MRFFFPQNIFTRLISEHLGEELNPDISFRPSSVLSGELEKNPDAVGLIPVMDLINHKEFFVSSKYGISFENQLSNSYLYYSPEQREIKDIHLFGDISSQEVILSKLLFKELYDTVVQIHLVADNNISNKNLIISGDQNFADNKFIKGVSLADEVTESLNLPYVNYIFASNKKEVIEELHSGISGIEERIFNDVEGMNIDEKLPELSRDYIKSNISSLVVNFDQQDLEGLEQLIRLPYFHAIIESIVEVKYV
ncbi:MAG: hypothetical protein R6W90_06980 [Ignavibacteriaceae bacterium]